MGRGRPVASARLGGRQLEARQRRGKCSAPPLPPSAATAPRFTHPPTSHGAAPRQTPLAALPGGGGRPAAPAALQQRCQGEPWTPRAGALAAQQALPRGQRVSSTAATAFKRRRRHRRSPAAASLLQAAGGRGDFQDMQDPSKTHPAYSAPQEPRDVSAAWRSGAPPLLQLPPLSARRQPAPTQASRCSPHPWLSCCAGPRARGGGDREGGQVGGEHPRQR